MSAKRTYGSPYSPKPMPGETATFASCSRNFENSTEPIALHGSGISAHTNFRSEAHVRVAVLAEADAGRDRDLRLLQQELRELDRAHRLARLGDLRPHEHRAARLLDSPADAVEAVDQRVAAPAVGLANFLDAVLRTV